MSKKTRNRNLKKLKQKHDNKISEAQEIEEKIINVVFEKYINEDERIQLLIDAETFHYSKTKISNVQKAFENFNTDTIEYNIASDIIDMETHIQEYKKEGFFSKIANVVIPEDE